MSLTRVTPIVMALALAFFGVSDCSAATEDLDDALERTMSEQSLTGMVWSIVRGNGETTVGSAGVSDSETADRLSPDTRVHVGSLTKTLLATGILRLATEGRIDLDERAIHYLADLFPRDAPEGFSDITVRHLLDHTAGLSDAHMWQLFSERADPDAPLSAAFPHPSSQLQVRAQPGSRFSYSNMGYTLLGMIVESVVGERYETYLDENLLAPLGMDDSTFGFTTQAGAHVDRRLAWGHVDDGSKYVASATFLRPAAQFTTTAIDLARFARFLMSDGAIEGRPFIEEPLMRSRAVPFGTEAADAGLIAGYALGLGRRDRNGVVGYCHGGNIVGFVAMLCVFPDENKAYAYSVNTDSETADYEQLNRLFIEELDVSPARTPRRQETDADMSDWFGRYVLSPNRFQMFEYLDIVFGAIRVYEKDDDLVLTSMQRGDRVLTPVGSRLFAADDRATTSHAFFRGSNGEYLVSDGFVTFEKTSTVYLFAQWISIVLGIAGLAWIFVAGSISLARNRSGFLKRPEAPAYFASILLFAPIPFFFAQSFMALGDITVASSLLAIVTFVLPTGMLATLLLTRTTWKSVRMDLFNGAAAALALQWCVMLAIAGLLPFRLWA